MARHVYASKDVGETVADQGLSGETLDRNAAVPLYVQLADVLRSKIQSGEWKPDQRIPSENELNQIYGISRMTARNVLSKLVDEGLLFRVHGKGTFVAHQKISTKSPSYQGIREQLEQQGFATRTEMLELERIAGGGRIGQILGIGETESLFMVRRLRYAEDEPISIHESYVPERLAPKLLEADLVTRQLCTVLEENHQLRMANVIETLESSVPSKSTLTTLKARTGTPVLLLEQRISNDDGTPFEFTRILFRGDKVRLEFSYSL
ncbi:GntR family transcriptional regulator [Pseudoclavibacter sp. VKM Ac-2888]|nr:GntR family transcriptional regulator [Pseudoclavibacter sp. VKM Ac-2888]PPF36546.1 GntR family transcriptional regulator [Pseudoclavibacter sp. AY1H1]PPF74509.1 GntR family transcriptional regulator [Pseudoclavibacter sp. Z016]PPG04973.1 GntR family transcriptional regulator [Pseudoclavibacter sp. RFBI5]